ncbi:transposase [Apilactobacillus apisilvae]|uniref:Transposase n=1 Tax=Apilactobacillus apisilvae TaxID=2923364 RepID=A0ABY4PGI6_9LACO|nr:transposase [Apilactobacillus apisilvae]UQS84788.1 transposase [Apilactobacillus apisilvae]
MCDKIDLINWQPDSNHQAKIIDQVVESTLIDNVNSFNKFSQNENINLIKLLLFAYYKDIFSSRQINELVKEDLPSLWLTHGWIPSYKTICYFRTLDETDDLINQCMKSLDINLYSNHFLKVTVVNDNKCIITKHKYSFVWRGKMIYFDKLNFQEIISLLHDLNDAKYNNLIPKNSEVFSDNLDEIIIHLENCLDDIKKSSEKFR